MLTPLLLGLGCSVTLWLECVNTARGGFNVYRSLIGTISNCVSDSFAGIIGSTTLGKTPLPWCNNGKTVQGTLAFVLSYCVASLLWLQLTGDEKTNRTAVLCAGLVAGLLEGYTKSIDNFAIALVGYGVHTCVEELLSRVN